jgi:hypothetical protein
LSAPPDTVPAIRAATIEDLDRIESLTLDDFETDFSRVELPVTEPGERLTEQELGAAVESFLASLKGEDKTR